MAKKRGVCATFKTLGASSRLVLSVYLIQALMLAGIGIVVGLVLGALTLGFSPPPMARRCPSRSRSSRILCRFSGRRRSPHHAALRASAARPRQGSARRADALASHRRAGAAAARLHRHRCGERTCALALAIAASEERAITFSISAGIVGGFLLLLGFLLLPQKLAARFRRTKPAAWALALASIAGPGSIARQVAVSLGLGLGFLVA